MRVPEFLGLWHSINSSFALANVKRPKQDFVTASFLPPFLSNHSNRDHGEPDCPVNLPYNGGISDFHTIIKLGRELWSSVPVACLKQDQL